MTNNERKLRGIPLRRKIVHNRGAYKHWIDSKFNQIVYKIMAEILSTTPYPTPISMLKEVNEFCFNKERLECISRIATETLRDNRTYRFPSRKQYGYTSEVCLFDEGVFIPRKEN